MRHKMLLAALTFSVPCVSRAQVSVPVSEGERVRIETMDSNRAVVGTVDRLSADSLFVTDDKERAHAIATSSISSAEVSLGKGLREDHMVFGAVLGAGVVSVFLVAQGSPLLPVQAILYVPVGALVGAIGGAMTPGEHWERVEVRKNVRLGLIPSARGFGAQLSFR